MSIAITQPVPQSTSPSVTPPVAQGKVHGSGAVVITVPVAESKTPITTIGTGLSSTIRITSAISEGTKSVTALV